RICADAAGERHRARGSRRRRPRIRTTDGRHESTSQFRDRHGLSDAVAGGRAHQLDAGPRHRQSRRLGAWPRARRGRSRGRRTHAFRAITKDTTGMTTDAITLAARMQNLGMSPTMKGTMEADRLRRQGVKVIDLGAGEPDFPTPAHVTAAAHDAIEKQFTKYTANPGIMELREAVVARYKQDYGVSYQAEEAIITAGGKQALFHAALALFGPGDEVITHVPGWPTLVEQVKLSGATPVVVRARAEDGFALKASTFLAAV